jgi:nucleoid DNA-binding protein
MKTKTHYRKGTVILKRAAFMDQIVGLLKENNRVYLMKFGTFEKRRIAGRKFHNFQTGEISIQKARTKLHFVPSTTLKRIINK